MWRGFAIAAITMVALQAPSHAAADAAANRLVVEAALLFNQAEAEAEAGARAGLFGRAGAVLRRVVIEQPQSAAAVTLATGQGFGPLSLEAVAEGNSRAEGEACLEAPASRCLFDLAFATARAMEAGEADELVEPRDHALNRIASGLVGLGELDRAREVVDAIASRDIRFYRLRDIADEQIEAGDAQAALETLSRAYWIVRDDADESDRSGSLSGIAAAWSRAGSVEAALAIVDEVAEGWRAPTLVRIAGAQIDAGERAGALSMLSAALVHVLAEPEGLIRNMRLSSIAETQARAGDEAGALRTVRRIAKPSERVDALIEVARMQREFGDAARSNATLATALDLASALAPGYDRWSKIDGIIDEHVEAGELTRALRATGRMGKDNGRARALVAIAKSSGEAGETERAREILAEALAIVRRTKDGDVPVYVLLDMAAAQAAADDPAGARTTIARALPAAAEGEDAEERARNFASIAEVLARTGDTNGARVALLGSLASASAIEDNMDHAEALNFLSETLDEIEPTAGARAILSAAADAVGAREEGFVGEGFFRDMTLEMVSSAQADAGDIAGALQTAKTIYDADFYVSSLIAVAAKQTERGETAAARDILDDALAEVLYWDESVSYLIDLTLMRIFAIQLDAGDEVGGRRTLLEVVKRASAVAEARERADDYAFIADRLAEKGR